MPSVGMDPGDRQTITRNIGRLVELTNIDLLIPKLLEKDVFSSTMIEKYLPNSGLNLQQRKTTLYLDIQRRGPLAFEKLITSLVEIEHFELAELLQPGHDLRPVTGRVEYVVTDALPSGNHHLGTTPTNLPTYFSPHLQNRIVELSRAHPNAVVNWSTEPIQVSVRFATERSTFPKPCIGVYPMGSQPKGYFLMINNIKFVNDVEEERTGAEVDHQNLTILFQQLGYVVVSYKNLSLIEMKTRIQEFSHMEEHKHVHSCVVSILSHGRSGTEPGNTDIVASDGLRLPTSWVLECFNNYHCPNLMGRPKVFIFQTCRGNREDYGVRPPQMLRQRVATDGYPASQIRSYSDMLIAYSTIPGIFCLSSFVSNRDLFCGTWYIQAICKIFMEHACDTEIQDMLIMVDNNLKHLIAENNTMQTSSFENWGFQKFYFNPGLYDDDPASSENNSSNSVPDTTI